MGASQRAEALQGELGSRHRRSISPETTRGQLPTRAFPTISFTACQTFKARPCPTPSPWITTVSPLNQQIFIECLLWLALCSSDRMTGDTQLFRLKPPPAYRGSKWASLKDTKVCFRPMVLVLVFRAPDPAGPSSPVALLSSCSPIRRPTTHTSRNVPGSGGFLAKHGRAGQSTCLSFPCGFPLGLPGNEKPLCVNCQVGSMGPALHTVGLCPSRASAEITAPGPA